MKQMEDVANHGINENCVNKLFYLETQSEGDRSLGKYLRYVEIQLHLYLGCDNVY
jgi:hypothetical protein